MGRYDISKALGMHLRREKIVGPRAHETISVADLPADWDWRNVNGTNFLTESRNQHIPQYCGSCWAFGTLSSLNDRLKIARKAAYPDTILAPQVLINCGGGGSCNGGNVGGVFEYMASKGLPDETCQSASRPLKPPRLCVFDAAIDLARRACAQITRPQTTSHASRRESARPARPRPPVRRTAPRSRTMMRGR